METGLRIIGSDAPAVNISPISRIETQQADFTVANQLWDRSQATRQKASEELLRANQAQMIIKQAELQKAQQDSQGRVSPIAEVFGGVANVLNTMQQVKAQRAEQEAALAEKAAINAERRAEKQAQIDAQQFEDSAIRTQGDILGQLQLDLQEADAGIQRDVDERGFILSYSDAVDFIQTYKDQLTPEGYIELVRWAGESYGERNQSQQDHLYGEAREARLQAGEQVLQRIRPALVGISAQLANAMTPQEASRYISNADALLQDVQTELLNNGMEVGAALRIINQEYDGLMTHASTNAFALAELQTSQRKYEIYGQQISDIEDDYQQDGDTVTRDRRLAAIKLQLTGEVDFGLLDSTESMGREVERLNLARELADLNTPEGDTVSGVLQGTLLLQMSVNGGTAPAQYTEDERKRLEGQLQQATRYDDQLRSSKTEIANLINERVATKGELDQMTTDAGRLQRAIEQFQSGNTDALASLRMTAADAQTELQSILAERAEAENEFRAIDAQILTLRQQEQQASDALTLMGLPYGLDYRAHQEYMQTPEYQEAAQAASEQAAQRRRESEVFTSGVSNTAPVPLASVDAVLGSNQEDWTGIPTPFVAGTRVEVSSGQGWRPSTGTQHRGVDFQMPAGTPIIAPRSGRVTRVLGINESNGGGHVVELEHADGTRTLYMHLQSRTHLNVGDAVTQGAPVGLVGSTGRSTGNHLHFEVRANGQEADASDWLRSTVQETHSHSGYTTPSMGMPPSPAASTPGAPLTGTAPVAQYQPPPEGALILENGDYFFNGQYYYNEEWYQNNRQVSVVDRGTRVTHSTNNVSTTYNNAAPIAGALSSAERSAYNVTNNDPTANYGYEFFRRNPSAAAKVAQVANALQIPAQWLVDIMATETGGTFNPREPERGGSGAVGLIQFHPSGGLVQVARDMGVSTAEAQRRLVNMSFNEQMDWVQAYLSGYSRGDTQFVGTYDRVERLLAAVFLGQGRAQGDLSALTRLADTNVSFGEYMTKLGNGVGRRYYTLQDQLSGTEVHNTNHSDCPTCQSMIRNGVGIVAHIRP